MTSPGRLHAAGLKWTSPTRRQQMIRSRSYLIEIAAQVALAAAIGLFVSIALASAAMLLAA
jgi:hypothetical protein